MHPIRFVASISTLALCLTAVLGPPGTLAQSDAPSDPLTGRWQTPELTQAQIQSALDAAGLPADGIAAFTANADWTYPVVWSIQFDAGHYLLQGNSGGGVLQTLDQATYKVVDDHTLLLTNDCCVVTFDYSVAGDLLKLRQVAQTNDPGGDSAYYGTAIFGVDPFQRATEGQAPSTDPGQHSAGKEPRAGGRHHF